MPSYAIQNIANLCLQHDLTLTTAESCTGGGVAQALTELAGASEWFEGGWVTYSEAAKQKQLGVPHGLFQTHGAVSAECAEAMAQGALTHSARANVAISVTGFAGPGGGTEQNPVGTVYMGFAYQPNQGADVMVTHQRLTLQGDRQSIREQSIVNALRFWERKLKNLLPIRRKGQPSSGD